MITPPTRTLQGIRADLMKLERELSHHFGLALEQQDRERADTIGDIATDMHHAALKLGAFVRPGCQVCGSPHGVSVPCGYTRQEAPR